jgi:glycosyltransferase involved in cell wall biosynthesis
MNDKPNPLVTIAIPTYNRANGFLKQALQSAVNQTYRHLEIIVSDNCSKDHTEMLVKTFDDPRIRYIKHPTNIGASNNFNFCVNEAKGIYFCMLHDDDLIDPDFIEMCIASLKGNFDVGIVFTGNRVIDEHSNIKHQTINNCGGLSAEDFLLSWFNGKVGLYFCSTLYHTEKLKKIGGLNSKTNLMQDAVADILLAWYYGRVDVPDVKASFRRHSDNRAGGFDTLIPWVEDSLHVYNLLCKLPTKNSKIFRKKAITFLATKNYKLAGTIQSLPKRIKAYAMINRKYNYAYSPIKYYYHRQLKPIENRLKRKIKPILSPFLSR